APPPPPQAPAAGSGGGAPPSRSTWAQSWRSCGSSASRPPPPAPQHYGTSCSRHQRPSSPGPLASTIRPPAGSRSTLARPGTSTPPETTHSHHERPAAQEYALFRYAAVPVPDPRDGADQPDGFGLRRGQVR